MSGNDPSVGIVWHASGDRAPFLAVAMEWQKQAVMGDALPAHIFVDPLSDRECLVDEFTAVGKHHGASVTFFDAPVGRSSWVMAIYQAFEKYGYQAVFSIEEDVVISRDFLALGCALVKRGALARSYVLYFHAGAWRAPSGSPNDIGHSGISSRALLITREKFYRYILPAFEDRSGSIRFNDLFLQEILTRNQLSVLAPVRNRHGHFGVYGLSVCKKGFHKTDRSQVFGAKSFDQACEILRRACLSKDRLYSLNPQARDDYFWDFAPDVVFDPDQLRVFPRRCHPMALQLL